MSDTPTPGQVAYAAYVALMDEALRCACDTDDTPLCVRCDCLFSLVTGAVHFAYADIWRRRGHTPPPTWTPQKEYGHA